MTPDFLVKLGITSVRDNLQADQTVIPPVELFARLFTDELLEIIDHGVPKHHEEANECNTGQTNDSGNRRSIKRYAVSSRRKRRINAKCRAEKLSNTE